MSDETSNVEDKESYNNSSFESFVAKVCDKINLEESYRHSILSALHQITLNDDENFARTEYIGELMEGKGFEVIHQMTTRNSYNVLYVIALKFKIARNLTKRAARAQT